MTTRLSGGGYRTSWHSDVSVCEVSDKRFSFRQTSRAINITIVAGEKEKERKEEEERESENQRRAGSVYASPEPSDINEEKELSGLPWGGVSMKHIMETSRSKEQLLQQDSRETSEYPAATSRAGGSSR